MMKGRAGRRVRGRHRERLSQTRRQLLPGSQAPGRRSWLFTASKWAVSHQQLAVIGGRWHGATSSFPPQHRHAFHSRESLLLTLPLPGSLADGQTLEPISCQPPRKPRPMGSLGVSRKACPLWWKADFPFIRRPLTTPLITENAHGL